MKQMEETGYEQDGRAEGNLKGSSGIKNSEGTVSPPISPSKLSTTAGGCGFWKIWSIKPVVAIKGQN